MSSNYNLEDKKVVVFVNKITSVESVNNALERVENRFNRLEKLRNENQDSRDSESNQEELGNLMDADKAMAAEQQKLIELRGDLHARKDSIIEARAEEVTNYTPKKVDW